MFKKVLIANRGEIACRVIETCHRLGIQSVAVYSEAETQARHVEMADEAFYIGKAAPQDSYLQMETILKVATTNGVEAIHPGYGFLSENAEFARHCQNNDIVFIGPSPEAIEAMGSKSQAKHLMEQAQVPIVPGYHGVEQNPRFLQEEANLLGYPLMIKAVAGGGGKGMRLVEKADDFLSMLESAKRETLHAFGDEAMLLERFVTTPRHIEFQVFGDHQGNVVHLFERECSIQRRHQKIIEETPSPFLDETLRQQMGEAAVTAAKAIGYVGAGTIEFIVGVDRVFYFMEMNTRLQVEHPITEMTIGVDLVEWQLRVANQEPLPCQQQEIKQQGHAIEGRIYAENPQNHFFPATGRLHQWVHPAPTANFRVDTGIRQGDEMQIDYDPLIAKLIVWGEDRKKASQHLDNVLAHTGVLGVQTNVSFLQAIARHPQFLKGNIDTLFVDHYLEELLPPEPVPSEWMVWSVGIWNLLQREIQNNKKAQHSSDPHSPWHRNDYWQLNGQGYESLDFQNPQGEKFSIQIRKNQKAYQILLPEKIILVAVKEFAPPFLTLQHEGKQESLMILQHESNYLVLDGKDRYPLSQLDPFFVESEGVEAVGQVRAPMPGHVRQVLVKQGDFVKVGQTLLILEAMKMEHRLQAPNEGKVEAIHYPEGEKVDEAVVLITIAE